MEKDADTANTQAFQHSAQSPETDAQSFEHKVVGLRLNLTNRKRAYQSHIRKEQLRGRFLSTSVAVLLLAGAIGYYYRADILPSDKPTPPAPTATLESQIVSVAPETASEIAPQRRPHIPPSPHTQEEEPVAAEQKDAARSLAADSIDSSGLANAAGADDESGALQTSPPATEVETAPAETPVVTALAMPNAPPLSTQVSAAASTPIPESPASVVSVPETIPTETQKALTAAPEPPIVVAKKSLLAAPAPPLDHIRIAGSQACAGVQARRCKGAQENFVISQHAKPYVWMLVYSKSLPYVLKHVYYHEGRKYVQVPLTIKHKRMRTWSTITLKGLAHVGSWRVDIESTDGTVLDQVEFQVSP